MECQKLFAQGFRKEYPCAECPGALRAENYAAWELFLSAAARSEIEVNKTKRDVFEVDWQLVRLLLDTRAIAEPADVVDKLVALTKDLNS